MQHNSIRTLALTLGLLLIVGCARNAGPGGGGESGARLDSQHGGVAEPTAEPPAAERAAPGSGAHPQSGAAGLVGVARIADGYRLSLRGTIQPFLRLEDGALVVDLPGARLSDGITLPPGVGARWVEPEAVIDPLAGGRDLNATIPTRMPAGGVRLTLPSPGGPYALYRHDANHLDLRIRPPGLAGKRIVIDPGHGAEEIGAVGPGNYPEKTVNLEVALRLRPLLEAAGAEVIMTRTADTRAIRPEAAASGISVLRLDLTEWGSISNRTGADLFLSIHANGGPAGQRGSETYWTLRNLNASRSQTLARLVQEELGRTYGFPDRGAKQRAFNVVRTAEAPAVLVELGFLTDPGEGGLLTSAAGQEQGARALFRAIERFFAP